MSNRINLSPLHWGPKAWFFLDSIAMAYPVQPTNEEKNSAKNLILSLSDLLPCETCRINYKAYLTDIVQGNYLDDVVKNRDTLFNFFMNVHNDVRTKNGSPTRSIEEIFSYYQEEYSKKHKYESVKNIKDIKNIKDLKIETCNNTNTNTNTIESFSSDILFHFNPITLLIGFMIGLIIFKFYSDNMCKKE